MSQYPLYSTSGDWVGLLVGGYLYSRQGEWIGWVDRQSQVYSVVGEYVGWLSRDFRVLRKREMEQTPPRRPVASRPALKIQMPSSAALPPLMGDLGYDTIDVFDDSPERLHTVDNDPAAQDMD